MKTIVTHFHPDVDAICAVWFVRTFVSGWQEAVVAFVAAGQTLDNKPVDSDPDILHVDTGLGRFDHHQTAADTCAARLLFEYLRGEKTDVKGKVKDSVTWHEEALERLVTVVNDIDHFKQIFWPEPANDRYEFAFEAILDGWKLGAQKKGKEHDLEIVERGCTILDGIYASFINKVWAEEELGKKKQEFNSPWGKSLAIETINDDCIAIALKEGYTLAIRRDPNKGYIRIKAHPGKKVDLTGVYQALKTRDPEATWFLHASRQMVLNGTAKNPGMKATTLSLDDVVEVIKGG